MSSMKNTLTGKKTVPEDPEPDADAEEDPDAFPDMDPAHLDPGDPVQHTDDEVICVFVCWS